MPLTNATAAFIGASVTLFLVIVFMILMVILVRQCLAFLAKRNTLRAQTEHQLQARRQLERQRRGSVTEPVPATFDWHHSIRIAGTPPPSYNEAKELPSFDETVSSRKKKRSRRERSRGRGRGGGGEQVDGDMIVTRNRSVSVGNENTHDNLQADNSQSRRHTSPHPNTAMPVENGSSLTTTVELENERNTQMMTTEGTATVEETTVVQVAVDMEPNGQITTTEGTTTVQVDMEPNGHMMSNEGTTAVQVAVDVERTEDRSGELFDMISSEGGDVVEVNRSAHQHTMQTT